MADLARIPGLCWRLYYEDGTTFSNLDGEPWESPLDGCVGFVQTDTIYNADRGNSLGWIYIYRSDKQKWMSVEEIGHMDQQRCYARFITAVRPGRHVTNEEWNGLSSKMANDQDFFPSFMKEPRFEK